MSSPHFLPIEVNYTIQLKTLSLNFLSERASDTSTSPSWKKDQNHTDLVPNKIQGSRDPKKQRRKGEHMACYGKPGRKEGGKGAGRWGGM